MKALGLMSIAVLVCFVGVAVRAEEKIDYAKLIVGKWEATKVDEGTLPKGAIVEFTKDGKMKISAKRGDVDMSFDGTYKIQGNKFDITVKVDDQEHKDTITINKIDDKEMSTSDKDGKVVVLTRKK